MSNESDRNGRAFEYACINCLYSEISSRRKATILKDNNYTQRKTAWDSFDSSKQTTFTLAAKAAIPQLFNMEPMILEDTNDILEMSFLSDSQGIKGDVRDIVLKRKDVCWEIGFSIKHNHFAVKHSRLSSKLDFCKSWFKIECTKEYWDEIKPIFSYLNEQKNANKNWKDLPNKISQVYIPLLQAFINEINRQYSKNGSVVPVRMVEYLLGEYDFYKIIGVDVQRVTEIKTFNLHGTLNKPSKQKRPTIVVPIATLPDRIVDISMKPESDNTVELYLNNGWQFSFRIHNASTKVEPSLKFDIQFVGVPSTILSINCIWY